jgi:hypothetical protein
MSDPFPLNPYPKGPGDKPEEPPTDYYEEDED